ncbi:MAG: hypothetical protein HY537_17230 [Deltaproteobacteria bacterium]|nr:hypothetical protein [Deltaproteobacteria bacterium]
MSNLPTIDEVEKNKDLHPHLPPKALSKAADWLGEVRGKINAHKGSLTSAAQFYDSCARKDRVLIAVRALCLRNLMDISLSSKSVHINSRLYPKDVADIASHLPSVPFKNQKIRR